MKEEQALRAQIYKKARGRPNVSLIAAVVWDVLRRQDFTDDGELRDVVKCRCATLRVPYDSGTVADAVRLVSRSRATLVSVPRQWPRYERSASPPPLSRADAERVLDGIYQHLGIAAKSPLRSMR